MQTCIHPFSLKKHEQIRKSSEFEKVFRNGKRWRFRGFRVCFMRNRLGFSRIGLSAGRRIGGAVRRNKAKRRARELFRLNKAGFKTGFDIIFMPDAEFVSVEWKQLEREFNKLASRLSGLMVS